MSMIKNMTLKLITIFSLSTLLISCTNNNQIPKEASTPMNDPHSFSNPGEAKVTHLNWDAVVSFESKTIEATATYDISTSGEAEKLILDTYDLNIRTVKIDGDEVEFLVGEKDQDLGTALTIPISSTTKKVAITYSTSPDAAALQWLEPSQTAGKEQPFLFTQSQAILARTWIPCQDSPGVRFSYSAKVQVPSNLMAVMSAENPQTKNSEGVYTFRMPQPIPSYLMALAVGDLTFEAIGPRTGVYAEPSMIEASAYEFADMEKMLIAAEELYGKYAWDRYDVIVLPPSFPFGGMENPRLTFATPTILAGDRSLTSLIAHELAHSWSGNVVTNATWNDFWLNEGFTVYFENRIMESLYGKSYTDMLRLLGYQGLVSTVEDLGKESPDTHLYLNLEGRNPDDGMTDIAYEKGNFFLHTIEKTVGREKFDAFLKKYFETYGFKPMNTEIFVEHLNSELLTTDELKEQIKADQWIYQPGIPDNIVIPESDRFVKVEGELARWNSETPAIELNTDEWTTHEWLHFLKGLPESMTEEEMTELDDAFGFTESGNSEISGIWLVHVVRNKYNAGYDKLESFLVNVGRRKFLSPIYKEMAKDPEMKAMAKQIYEKARPNYHSVSFMTIDEILE